MIFEAGALFLGGLAGIGVHVFGDARPKPQSETASSQTDVILSSTMPAGTMRHAMAMPTAMNPFRTAVSRHPLRISQSLANPAIMIVADMARKGTEL